MKNMAVRTKLIFSFAIMLLITLIISTVAVMGLGQLETADTRLYERNFVATTKAYKMLLNLTGQRSQYRDVILALEPEREATVEQAVAQLRTAEREMQEMMDEYAGWAALESAIKEFNLFREIYDAQYKNGKEQLIAAAQVGDKAGAIMSLTDMAAQFQVMSNHLTAVVTANLDAGHDSVNANTELYQEMVYIQIAMILVAAAVSVIIVLVISNLVAKPLKFLSALLDDFSQTGRFVLDGETAREQEGYSGRRDEVGAIARSVSGMTEMLSNKVATLEIVSEGDLTAEIERRSKSDLIGNALQKMVDSLGDMFSEIGAASREVSTGSKQIADGAQSLAQGATEQASAVEQLSASIIQVAEKTTSNAEIARKANELSGDIKSNAEKGSAQMGQLMQAVKDINTASNSIGNIIKVIDDIAFQTNILALNAAVEAARAGQHGRGFAVVAEEVRNLASKSAAAAKDTGSMIEDSIKKADFGLRTATETADSLKQIVDGIDESVKIIQEIADSSMEQSASIAQINTGINQVAQVVQQNSASAEESAAASEQMSSQSVQLQRLVGQFKLKDAGARGYGGELLLPEHASY